MMNDPSLILNSIKPYLDIFTASKSSSFLTKVPLFTLGIKPLGPRILAIAFSDEICSGVAIILSKLILPSAISLRVFSSPIMSAPSSLDY